MKIARQRNRLTPHQKRLRRAEMRQEKRRAKMWSILSGTEEKKSNLWESIFAGYPFKSLYYVSGTGKSMLSHKLALNSLYGKFGNTLYTDIDSVAE
ncbi:MAG TPA: hypothetical protein VFM18_17780 [Methanosarcina sp.]|nr:hypothetical protein [Methanosarcina sp.]